MTNFIQPSASPNAFPQQTPSDSQSASIGPPPPASIARLPTSGVHFGHQATVPFNLMYNYLYGPHQQVLPHFQQPQQLSQPQGSSFPVNLDSSSSLGLGFAAGTVPPPIWMSQAPVPDGTTQPVLPQARFPVNKTLSSFSEEPQSADAPQQVEPINMPPAPAPRLNTPIGLKKRALEYPFLFQPLVHMSNVPQEVQDSVLMDILKRGGIATVSISLSEAVNPDKRLWPDAYYDWMKRTGTLSFTTLHDAEKALGLLHHHPYLVGHLNVLFSPFPPPHPLPPSGLACRIIRPTRFIGDGAPTLPAEGMLWDCIRPWGAMRELSLTLEVSRPSDLPEDIEGSMRWRARVDFWDAAEADHFEATFAHCGNEIAGWQVDIRKDPTHIFAAPMPMALAGAMGVQPNPTNVQGFPVLPITPSDQNGKVMGDITQVPPNWQDFAAGISYPQMPSTQAEPKMYLPWQPTGAGMYPVPPFSQQYHSSNTMSPSSPLSPAPPGSEPSTIPGIHLIRHPGDFAPGSGQGLSPTNMMLSNVMPPTPPPSATPVQVPWVNHNRFTRPMFRPPVALGENDSSFQTGGNSRGRGGGSRHHWSTPRPPKATLADDETTHVPHLSQATSHVYKGGSGIIDPCNLIVKNLDGDVTSAFLADIFRNIGPVVNSRVMRDDSGRSRGYGFVSFNNAQHAADALQAMNGTTLGNQVLAVQYHQPKRRLSMGGRNWNHSSRSFAARPPNPRSSGEPGVHWGPKKHWHERSPSKPANDQAGASGQSKSRSGSVSFSPNRSPMSLVKSMNNLELDTAIDPQTRLRIEIERIDPTDANAIIKVLNERFEDGDLKRCLESKAFLVSQYSHAKRIIAKQKRVKVDEAIAASGAVARDPPPHFNGAGRDSASSPLVNQEVDKVSAEADSKDATSPDKISLSALAGLNPKVILQMIKSAEGDHMLSRLGVKKIQTVPGAASWSFTLRDKPPHERKMAIVREITRFIDTKALGGKSRAVKVVRDIVNAETDEDSLCDLLSYPAIINTKVVDHAQKSYMGSYISGLSGTSSWT